MKLGLLGWPISHSKSPLIHSLALRMANIEGSYDLYAVDSGEKSLLVYEINKVRTGEVTGFNVTIPYKEEIIQYMDRLTPTAKAVGAVNTIFKKDGLVIGDNTDAPGFSRDLGNHGLDLFEKPGEAIVFGAGGSARAVLFALLNSGWQVNLLVRNVEKSREMVQSLKVKGITGGIKIKSVNELSSTIKQKKIDLIVNTTPLGMVPNIDGSPWKNEIDFPRPTFVYDLVYNPTKTKLLELADKAGINFANGFGMLIEQALMSFEIWTGEKIDRLEFERQFALLKQ